MTSHSIRLLQPDNQRRFFRYAKANVLDIPNSKNPREKFSSIVDANDRLLERLAEGSFSDTSTSDGLLKLLTSTTVRRPQTLFTTPPDNSPTPFRPKLPCKPNAIVPLSGNSVKLNIYPFLDFVSENLDENDECPHPYQAELEAFCGEICKWEPLNSKNFPCKPLDSCYQFVDTPDLLDATLKEISVHKEVAVDLEHHSHRTYLGITCLVQLSTRDGDYIIDALALRDHLYKLNEIFTNPRVIKVFHGSHSDLMWLQRDFSVYVVNLFDTGVAARELQLGRFSLTYLLQRYVNVRASKKYQLADWRIRPLPDELIEYARTDTHYLLYVASVMCQELQDRGRLHVVLERCRQLCLKRYSKPVFDPLGYLNTYKQAAGTSFSHRQLYALEQLYALRDSIARREDESVHYVLPNHMLKVISELLPRESSGLFACCNPIPPLVRKYVHDLHKIVLDARNRPIEELPTISDPSTAVAAGPETDSLTLLETDPSTDIGSQGAAPAHDHSHEFDQSARCTHETVALKSSPSPLGLALSCSRPNLSSYPKGLPKMWPSTLIDPNRSLLKTLLQMLSTSHPASMGTNSQMECDTNEVRPIPAQTFVQPRQNPVETVIKLETEDTAEAFVSVKAKKAKNMSEQSPITVDSSTMDATSDSKFHPDEVFILQDEMPSKSKRNQRHRGNKRNNDIMKPSISNSSSEVHTSLADVLDTQENDTENDAPVLQVKPSRKRLREENTQHSLVVSLDEQSDCTFLFVCFMSHRCPLK
ncbi:Exosome complex exonuclease rrp6 [Paragonimus heterotremus]|uniref:Exosome complex exonuclease rrp6 n=1 Tax=Paragonimus heterotremus TaxID=100268 RepID=A0A8J4TH54_9TREM|nr:Exosome complex exonuclease rrp6 [Paragonimus heterotremus]